MSVISYTDVCFIDVAAEPFATAVRVQQRGRMRWAQARSAICTGCRNGRVCKGGRCVGHPLQGRRGD